MSKHSALSNKITDEDLAISATLSDLPSLLKILNFLKSKNLSSLLDCGCGYGGLTIYVANYLGIREVYGIDIDDERLSISRQKGITTYKVDLNSERFPVSDERFDLITSFGALEHLIFVDNFFSESFRVLRKGGYLLISMPNLGSYINRIALLFGFQPRDVEISRRVSKQGFLPGYGGEYIGHIHSATLRAIKQVINGYGFNIIKIEGSRAPHVKSWLIKFLDVLFSRPSLSRRFIILAQKPME